jgi:hypothetical protein
MIEAAASNLEAKAKSNIYVMYMTQLKTGPEPMTRFEYYKLIRKQSLLMMKLKQSFRFLSHVHMA